MDESRPSDRLSDTGLAARLSPELLLCLEEVWDSIDLMPLTQVVRARGAGADRLVISVYEILTKHGGTGEEKSTRVLTEERYKRGLNMMGRSEGVAMTQEGGWCYFKPIGKEGAWVGPTTWRIYAHAKNEQCALQLGSFIIEHIMFAKDISLTSFKLPLSGDSVCTRADNCVLYFSTKSSVTKALQLFHLLDASIFEDTLPRLVTREGAGFGYGQEPAMISVDFETCLATGNTAGLGEKLELKKVGQQSFNKLRAELILLALLNVKARSQSRRGGGGSFEGFVKKVLSYFEQCGLDTIDTGIGRGPESRLTIGSGKGRIHVLRERGG